MIDVSVIMITYNHEKFIEKAINGVLIQECDFEIELIVANDSSIDLTDEIIQNIIKNHPRGNWIRYIKHEKNIGMQLNFLSAYSECKGEYISLCEGDDYWTDPLKLQKQVDFLEQNSEYNLCFHNIQLFNQESNSFSQDTITRNVSETTCVTELAKGNYIHTPSVVLRNNFIIPSWFSQSSIGDWTLYMIAVKDKKIKKIEDIMAVYRVHSASIWALKSEEYRVVNTIRSVELLIKSREINNEVKLILKEQIKMLKKILPIKKTLFRTVLDKIKKLK